MDIYSYIGISYRKPKQKDGGQIERTMLRSTEIL